jgi:hypothetical protein
VAVVHRMVVARHTEAAATISTTAD